jgi:hypothetical protein
MQVMRYDNDSDGFKGSSVGFASLACSQFDWVHFWEHLDYLKDDKSQRVKCSDGSVGYVCKRSSTPKEGYKKHHEIHLVLGDGKNFDSPERSMWFCATNGVMPYR